MIKRAEIKFRLTNDEKEYLFDQADKEGMTLSEYIRLRVGLSRKYEPKKKLRDVKIKGHIIKKNEEVYKNE